MRKIKPFNKNKRAPRRRQDRNVPWIGKRGINKAACNRIHRDGIWVVDHLDGYEFLHYDGSCCKIFSKDKCIRIYGDKTKGANLVAVVIFTEFNVNWHYSKEWLLKSCQKRMFRYGLEENQMPIRK